MKKIGIIIGVLMLLSAFVVNSFPWESNQETVYLTNETTSKVKIGNIDSPYKLTISGGVRDTGIYMYNKADDLGFVLRSAGTWGGFGTTTSKSDIRIFAGNIVRMIIKETTGNVGIGTTNPQSTLTVNGDIATIGGSFTRHGNHVTIEAEQDKSILFQTSGNPSYPGHSGFGNRMIVTSNGNIGIGDMSPAAALEITGGAFGSNTDHFMISSHDNLNGDIIKVTSTGDVGIGTINPQAKLHVYGDIKSNNLVGVGHAYACIDSKGVIYRSEYPCGTTSDSGNNSNNGPVCGDGVCSSENDCTEDCFYCTDTESGTSHFVAGSVTKVTGFDASTGTLNSVTSYDKCVNNNNLLMEVSCNGDTIAYNYAHCALVYNGTCTYGEGYCQP